MSKKKSHKNKKNSAAKNFSNKSKAAEVQALHHKYQSAITKTERKTQVPAAASAKAQGSASSPKPQTSTSNTKTSAATEKVVLYGNKPKTNVADAASQDHSSSSSSRSSTPKTSTKSSDGFIESTTPKTSKTYTPAPYDFILDDEADKSDDDTTSVDETAPTFEDWQSAQKQRIEEAFEQKQTELKLKNVELELNEASKPRRHFGRWLIASFATILILVAGGGGIWWFLSNYHPAPEVEVPATNLAVENIDFGQKVLNADGEEFTPVYQRGGLKNDLFIQFADLPCDEYCSNVQNLRFADRELIPGLDYNLVGENISLTLYADFLEDFEPGVYELTFDYEAQKVGLHITIEAVELTCDEGQTLQDGICVDEKGEEVAKPIVRVLPMPEQTNDSSSSSAESNQQPSNSNQNSSSNTQPTQPTISAEQLACERRIGPKHLTIIHWATDAEIEQALAAGKINPVLTAIEGGFKTDTGLATMKWVNGTCRPAIKAEYQPDVQPSIDILMSLDTFYIVNGYLKPYIKDYPNQDLLIWVAKDGSVKVETIANGYAVLEY